MPETNFNNRTLFHGDNLEFLRGMNSESVNLIATDPPFNKNKDFHATPDSLAKGARFVDRWRWDEDVHPAWVDQIKDDWPGVHAVIEAARVASGEDTAAFLCWLGVRVIEMRRVLRDDGSLYLHIDHTAHAWVKAMMDGIFGRKNFWNEIVWCYDTAGRSTRYWNKKHDTLLYYAKSGAHKMNEYRVPRKNLVAGWESWYREVDEDGRRYQVDGKGYKYYADSPRLANDWWADIRAIHSNRDKERTGYPTQKPLALYERIIKASSNPGDIVLDPFCGCATTPVAAERLGRQWVGMDIWDGAYDIVLDRLEKEGLAVPDPRQIQGRMIAFGDVHYSQTPPFRTDSEEESVPKLKLKVRRPLESWQMLSHAEIKDELVQAQASGGMVICAGCGRVLESEFMQLDHIQPRADGGANDISNRVLLCAPCNRNKGANLTLTGLVRANRKSGWMQDAQMAETAREAARRRAEEVRASVLFPFA